AAELVGSHVKRFFFWHELWFSSASPCSLRLLFFTTEVTERHRVKRFVRNKYELHTRARLFHLLDARRKCFATHAASNHNSHSRAAVYMTTKAVGLPTLRSRNPDAFRAWPSETA